MSLSWERIRQRKLVQWIVAYLAAAWLVLQLIDVLGDRWSWPASIGRAVDVLLIFGFFATLVLAWYHGEKGRQRVSGPELLIIALLLVVAGGAVLLVGRGAAGEVDSGVPGASVTGGPGENLDAASGGMPVARELDPGKVAVLPFENLSGSDEDLYFTDGVHDEILTQLTKIGSLRPISRTSVMAYRGAARNIREIAAELGARHIVEGAVQRYGDRVRIRAQLVDAAIDQHLWAETYERETRDLFAIQSDVAQRIAEALNAELTPEERARVEAVPTPSPGAHDLYLRGRFLVNERSGEGIERAIRHFEAAIASDSAYAPAWSGLADAYWLRPFYGGGAWPPRESFPRAREAAERALELDPLLAEAHVSRAVVLHFYDWDWQEAEREFLRALELNPGHAHNRYQYGYFLGLSGRFDEGIAEIRLALDQDPFSGVMNYNLGDVLYWSGRTEEAIAQYRKTLELDPESGNAIIGLAKALTTARRHEEVLEVLDGRYPEVGIFGLVALGREEEAREILEQVDRAVRESGRRWYRLVRVHAGLGELDAAFAALERSLEAREPQIVDQLYTEPLYASLWADPRATEFLARLDLPAPPLPP